MEEIKHYIVSDMKENGCKNEGWLIVPLWKLIIDAGMDKKIREICDDMCKGNGIKRFKNELMIPLNKWDKVQKDFKDKKELDPIKIKKFKKSKYYEIIDGRHRCVLSHYFGYTHIPCNLLNNVD